MGMAVNGIDTTGAGALTFDGIRTRRMTWA